MIISFYIQLKGIQMVALLSFATSRAFPVGSAGKAREAATGLLMTIWTKTVRSIIFLQILHIYLFLIHFTKYQHFRKIEQLEKYTISVFTTCKQWNANFFMLCAMLSKTYIE